MTDKKQALKDLLAKVEAGRVDHKANIPTFAVMFAEFTPATLTPNLHAYRAYNGSLDAAKALHEAVLPGWGWGRYSSAKEMYVTKNGVAIDSINARHQDPARAWLIAIIKALIAEETQ